MKSKSHCTSYASLGLHYTICTMLNKGVNENTRSYDKCFSSFLPHSCRLHLFPAQEHLFNKLLNVELV